MNPLKDAKRIIVKIGSSLLVDDATGALRAEWLRAMASDLADLKAAGKQVIVVSSGAVALGFRHLGMKQARQRLEQSQAAAAVGQILLAHAYREMLLPHDITVAQILLTIGDTEERRRYLNACNTLETLLRIGVLPIINENDTVATTEIRFGDNDRLAARVAQMISADCLLLLSDVDGLFTADPHLDPDATLIPVVEQITEATEAMAGLPARKSYGSGGMVTKLKAAKIAVSAGCRMAILNGTGLNPLKTLSAGGPATWFTSMESPKAARKQWISGILEPAGTLVIDDGAAAALTAGSSLLPPGVHQISGNFDRGDMVVIKNFAGRILGQGLCAYSHGDARRIIGHKSHEIRSILGYDGRHEMIHRNDLALR